MVKLKTILINLIPALSVVVLVPNAGQAQQGRTNDPNMGHFYMARQQITITDDGPLINNKMTQPGQPGAGAMPVAIPQGLPAARWTQYSPAENPNLSTSLPKVVNGVPPKMPPATNGPTGRSGKAGKLPVAARPAVVKQPAAPTTATYAPYKQFSPDAAITGASSAQSQSNVKGDVLHWARRSH